MAGERHDAGTGSGPDVSNRRHRINPGRIQVDENHVRSRPGPLDQGCSGTDEFDLETEMTGNARDFRSEEQVGNCSKQPLAVLRFHQSVYQQGVW